MNDYIPEVIGELTVPYREFKYWCPLCKKTVIREGLCLRRESYCGNTGRDIFIYLKVLVWAGRLIFVGIAVRATYYAALILFNWRF